jgi:YgiT-type zinc finger domain-containing protein
MTCVICKHGETRDGRTTVTLERQATTVIIKDVPAEICENCSEYYLSEVVTEAVMARAEQAAASGAEVQILRFAA